jgi:hypothetical protein
MGRLFAVSQRGYYTGKYCQVYAAWTVAQPTSFFASDVVAGQVRNNRPR